MKGTTNTLTVVPKLGYMAIRGKTRQTLTPRMRVLVGGSMADGENRWALEPLLRAVGKDGARVQKIGRGAAIPGRCVLVGARQDHAVLDAVGAGLSSHLSALGEEGYYLKTGPGGVRVVAEGPAGVFYAGQTLAQLVRKGSLPEVEIADAPRRPFRGIHLPSDRPRHLPQLKRLVSEVMPRHKANVLVLQLGYHFQFTTHPEIRETTWYTRKQIRELVAIARRNHVKVIPLLNCYGHQSWRTERIHALLRAYPEFNETPDMKKIRYCASWCPSNRKVYGVVYDLIDELIEAFDTDTIHLGMDEVFEFGQCPRCRGRKTNAEWFAQVVKDLYRHAAGRRKAKVLIWGDRLVDGRRTPYNPMNGARNGTHPARDRMPKDILLCDWHYHLHRSYPSVDQFERAGFDYVISGWRKMKAVNAFLSYAHDHGRKHLRGVLATNWAGRGRELDYLVDGRAASEEIRAAGECFYRTVDAAWSEL